MHVTVGYSPEELKEFKDIIIKKIEEAYENVKINRENLELISDQGKNKVKSLEDTPDVEERERINAEIHRREDFIERLENALKRIERGTYGICSKTGRLISKERLRKVPHTNHSLEAKKSRI